MFKSADISKKSNGIEFFDIYSFRVRVKDGDKIADLMRQFENQDLWDRKKKCKREL